MRENLKNTLRESWLNLAVFMALFIATLTVGLIGGYSALTGTSAVFLGFAVENFLFQYSQVRRLALAKKLFEEGTSF